MLRLEQSHFCLVGDLEGPWSISFCYQEYICCYSCSSYHFSLVTEVVSLYSKPKLDVTLVHVEY